jgi:hypothetical protein
MVRVATDRESQMVEPLDKPIDLVIDARPIQFTG